MRAILIAAVVLAGCSAPSTAPSTSPAPTTTPSESPLVSPSPTSTPAASASATDSPDELAAVELEGLAFIRHDAGFFGQVYLVGEGGAVRRLTDLDPASQNMGALALTWSPDGERLAYAWGPSVVAGWGILDAEGGKSLMVDGGLFAWSPDGKRAATGEMFDVAPPEAMNSLAVSLLDPNTGEAQQIGVGMLAGWHPDGERVVVVRAVDGGAGPQLVLISGEDGTEEALLTGAQTATWLPDGDRVAYVVPQPDCVAAPCERILLGETGASELTQLAFGHGPTWSPDGTRLAYTSDSAEGSRVAVLDLGTNETIELAAGTSSPTWSPDGRLLAVVSHSPQLQQSVIEVVDIETGEIVSELLGQSPAWRPEP